MNIIALKKASFDFWWKVYSRYEKIVGLELVDISDHGQFCNVIMSIKTERLMQNIPHICKVSWNL